MKFWIMALLLPGVFAFTDSVWEVDITAPQSGEVIVKSITDDGDRVRISVVPVSENTAQRETLELCSSLENESTSKSLLQQAFDKGQLVKVQYHGQFSRCIAGVELSQTGI